MLRGGGGGVGRSGSGEHYPHRSRSREFWRLGGETIHIHASRGGRPSSEPATEHAPLLTATKTPNHQSTKAARATLKPSNPSRLPSFMRQPWHLPDSVDRGTRTLDVPGALKHCLLPR